MLGLASWLVPFAASFLFFDQTGQPVIPQPLFKSLMIVIFGGVGVGLLVISFRHVQPSLNGGMVLGCYWLLINLALDLLILLPIMNVTVLEYLQDIGLRYLLIPIIAGAMGIVAARAGQK